jgi:HK97 family phage portal protein
MGILRSALEKRDLVENEFLLGRYGARSHSGAVVDSNSAMRSTAVYACVRIIAGTISMLPLKIFKMMPDGAREEARDSALYSLLHDAPNEEQTSLEFRDMLTCHLLLRGNAFAAIDRLGNGKPYRLVPLNPDCMHLRRAPDGTLLYEYNPVNGTLLYEYNPVTGVPQTFSRKAGNIMHLRGLSLDGVMGVSVIEYHREAIGLALATEEYSARFFAGGASPRGAIKFEGSMNKESAKKFRDRFEQVYGGLENSGRTAVLEGGMDWKQIGISPKDAQWIEGRAFQIDEIARIFQIPAHMLAATEKSSSWGTGIEQQELAFTTHTMGYWFTLWEQVIERDLMSSKERQQYFAEFIVDALMRGDSAARGAFYQRLWQMAAITPNQICHKENMAAYEGGDSHYTPVNYAPVGSKPTTPVTPTAPDDQTPPEEGL